MERYCDAVQYFSRTPLKYLSFDVTVRSASVYNEGEKHEVAKRRIAWNCSLPSPSKAVEWSALHHAQQNPDHAGVHPDSIQAAAFVAQLQSFQGDNEFDRLANYLETTGRLFTYTPADDYINPEEEESLVDPPQTTTPLTIKHLRSHRERRVPSNTMHFMLAFGIVRPHPDEKQYPVQWIGEERVMCTVTQIGDGMSFTTCPSLGQEHALHVDDKQMTTFEIVPVETYPTVDPTNPASLTRTRSTMLMTSMSMADASAAAPETAHNEALLREAIRGREPTARSNLSRIEFTSMPHGEDEIRMHILGTVRCVTEIQRDTLHVAYTPIYNDKCSEDKVNNNRCGIVQAQNVVSQVAFACRIVDADNVSHTAHVFNLPFELHCLLPFGGNGPRILFEVFSGCDGVSYEALEGYATVLLAPRAGMFKKEITLWRPAMTGWESIKAAFIGGAPSLAEPEILSMPRSGPSLSPVDAARCGFHTETAGELSLEWNCIIQRRPERKQAAPFSSGNNVGYGPMQSPLNPIRRRGSISGSWNK